jgi:hypothetical protein
MNPQASRRVQPGGMLFPADVRYASGVKPEARWGRGRAMRAQGSRRVHPGGISCGADTFHASGVKLEARGKRPAAGKTLLEVAIVVAIMSVALMLSATTLVALFRLERQIRASDVHRQTVARLASRLRGDVHVAVSANVNAGCELSLADGRTIQYAFAAPEITREVRRGEEVLHRDAFVLAPQAEAKFSVRTAPAGQFVELSIGPSEPQQRRHQASIRPLALVTAVNLHRAAPAMEAAP